jgi:predicted RNase H-like nuclease
VPQATASERELKAAEDILDALICARVGVAILEGAAEPLGDETAAIWVPQPVVAC